MSLNNSARRLPAAHPLALALALLLPGVAQAQQAAAAESEATTLDAIEVTAQRRVENIRDVPVSISTLSSEKLDVLASGGNDIRFLSARVPSLNIESSSTKLVSKRCTHAVICKVFNVRISIGSSTM